MSRTIKILLMGIIVSLYLFPLTLRGVPGVLNSKNLMAGLGMALLLGSYIKERRITVRKDVMILLFGAVFFSCMCLLAVFLNNTSDFSYASYIVSAVLWLCGGYAVCKCMRHLYGYVSVYTLIEYLTYVSLAQCLIAILINYVPPFGAVIDLILPPSDTSFFKDVNRLYGIGAALDPAGVRFAYILILFAWKTVVDWKQNHHVRTILGDMIVFILLTALGCMLSRTTIIGAALGLCYIALMSAVYFSRRIKLSSLAILLTGVSILLILSYSAYALYNNFPAVKENLRFAFEAFFNYMETGEFRTDSSDKLMTEMMIWPDSVRDWMIGTGLYDNFVYGTDVGYCRFILYCGLMGFVPFCIFFVINAFLLYRRHNELGLAALFLLAFGFVIWIKVSTDIFQIYTLLLFADIAFLRHENHLSYTRDVS